MYAYGLRRTVFDAVDTSGTGFLIELYRMDEFVQASPPLDKLSETDIHGDGGADSDCRIYIHIIRIFLHIGQSHTGAEAQ